MPMNPKDRNLESQILAQGRKQARKRPEKTLSVRLRLSSGSAQAGEAGEGRVVSSQGKH